MAAHLDLVLAVSAEQTGAGTTASVVALAVTVAMEWEWVVMEVEWDMGRGGNDIPTSISSVHFLSLLFFHRNRMTFIVSACFLSLDKS